MADMDKEMQELKKEVVEARNLVIKTDNLLKNLHADLKLVAKKQETFEKRSFVTSATAYILFVALASLGAYKFAAEKASGISDELKLAKETREKAEALLTETRNAESEKKAESAKALDLFEKLASGDDDKRNKALTEVATMQPKTLSTLEVRALQDKSLSLRLAAARDALEAGKTAFNRREYRAANEELTRYLTLSSKPEDQALFVLGQARHALRDFKGAVEPLESYLKAVPNSKSADYATMILGESLAESGEKRRAIQTYRQGADKYSNSQFANWMRTRARRLEQGDNAAEAAAEKPAAQSQAAAGQ